ncbi:iron-containing redox enzyme family protein [Nocardia sp. NPDC052001]|uniref:iron-containing redox enzyme family protein n=1 Tax=Nocardia sp. NPDC052001 TaxID=3154853 RepID=UPI00343523DE
MDPRARITEPGTLPRPCGPLSAGVIDALGARPGSPMPDTFGPVDPYGRDLHLALYTCYGLHHEGFDGVDGGWEWDPGLLRMRAELERRFLAVLRADTVAGTDVRAELDGLVLAPGDDSGVGAYLRDRGTPWQMREYLVHRSVLHHQEADPYAWLIPRLRGQAKASLVAVEFDEFGGGRGERIHHRLYADLLDGAGLDPRYQFYVDVVPAPMLALVNMMSLFGLHRDLRGAGAGHFAAVEITSSPASRRMVQALRRLDADTACVRFYREHVEADAVHEQLIRHGVIENLLVDEPELSASIVFGICATELLESRFADHVLSCWRAGRTSLLDGATAGTRDDISMSARAMKREPEASHRP